MIYLDNAASTYKKPLSVKWVLLKTATFYTANPGRSGHKLSYKAGMQVFNTRETLKQFFNAPSVVNVIFTGSCTEALNLALIGTAKDGKHIVITANEHNSVIRTVNHLMKTKNITYSVVLPNEKGEITLSAIKQAVTNDTYLIVTNHTSNVTGATSNITAIGQFAKHGKHAVQ